MGVRVANLTNVRAFMVEPDFRLDPIFVVLHDVTPGVGRLVVECFGEAWSGYWGAMGDRTLEQFLRHCDTDYITDSMIRRRSKVLKRDEDYLRRIVLAVKEALEVVYGG